MQKSNVPLECTSMVKFKPDMVYNVYRIFPDIYMYIYIHCIPYIDDIGYFPLCLDDVHRLGTQHHSGIYFYGPWLPVLC